MCQSLFYLIVKFINDVMAYFTHFSINDVANLKRISLEVRFLKIVQFYSLIQFRSFIWLHSIVKGALSKA